MCVNIYIYTYIYIYIYIHIPICIPLYSSYPILSYPLSYPISYPISYTISRHTIASGALCARRPGAAKSKGSPGVDFVCESCLFFHEHVFADVLKMSRGADGSQAESPPPIPMRRPSNVPAPRPFVRLCSSRQLLPRAAELGRKTAARGGGRKTRKEEIHWLPDGVRTNISFIEWHKSHNFAITIFYTI